MSNTQMNFIREVFSILNTQNKEFELSTLQNDVYPDNSLCVDYIENNIHLQVIYDHVLVNTFSVSLSRDFGKSWYYWNSGEYDYTEVGQCYETHCLDDMLDKIKSVIMNDRQFDDTVVVNIDLPEDIHYILLKEAHKLNMTFNDYMNYVLQRAVDQVMVENMQTDM